MGSLMEEASLEYVAEHLPQFAGIELSSVEHFQGPKELSMMNLHDGECRFRANSFATTAMLATRKSQAPHSMLAACMLQLLPPFWLVLQT